MTLLKSASLVVGGALIGGVCGALVVTRLLPSHDKAPQLGRVSTHEAPQGAKAQDDEEGVESVEALKIRLSSLERRVSLLTFAQEHRSPTREVADEEETDPGQPKKTVDDPVFEAAVRDIFDRVEDERDSQRNTRRDQRETERSERWVSAMSQQLQLREDQQQQVKALLQKQSESMRALRDSNAEDRPVLRSEWQAKMRAISQEAETALAGLLDASQRTKYDALDDADKIDSRGSFGRGAQRGEP